MNNQLGKTKLFCIIGNPVEHSLSPVMHNAGFASKKISAFYLRVPVKDLNKDVLLLRETGFSGFNITMPYKEKILDYADSLSPEVKKIGAANTAVISKGKIKLYNTDYLAAIKLISLKTNAKKKKALVIGSGGAAKAVSYALRKLGAQVYVTNRTFSKAQKLAKQFKAKAVKPEKAEKMEFEILVNATPVGMGKLKGKIPCSKDLIGKAELVYESVYNPTETKFLKEAKKMKKKTINGLEMLLEQGYFSFELFTGKKAPKKIMRHAISKELEI